MSCIHLQMSLMLLFLMYTVTHFINAFTCVYVYIISNVDYVFCLFVFPTVLHTAYNGYQLGD